MAIASQSERAARYSSSLNLNPRWSTAEALEYRRASGDGGGGWKEEDVINQTLNPKFLYSGRVGGGPLVPLELSFHILPRGASRDEIILLVF